MDAAKNGSNLRERRHFSPQQKVAIVKEHLVGGAPISKLCDRHRIQPTQFYLWQKQFFENGATAYRLLKLNIISGGGRRWATKVCSEGTTPGRYLRPLGGGIQAPYLPSLPALARASAIRYLASNIPRPPRSASLSPNF